MANYLTTDTELASVADAIRAKGETSDPLTYPNGFVSAIEAISGGVDISDTTATAGDVLDGEYFYTADGTKAEGTIPIKTSSDLEASGDTVTVPAGYYASQATKAVAFGSVSVPDTTYTANPTITIDGNGLITASISNSGTLSPIVSAGYVLSGTSGNIIIEGSNTKQLDIWTGGSY